MKYILFDLDGTLLPMDEKKFVKRYFELLVAKVSPYGYDGKKIVDSIWHGINEVIKSDGSKLNEDVFWDVMKEDLGESILAKKPIIHRFYKEEFDLVKEVCGYNPEAKETIYKIKALGFKVALCTNPVFPKEAIETRIKWTGLNPSDFDLYSSYENYHFAKPKLEFYNEFINYLKVEPIDCLMVGNNVDEDLVVDELKMKTFLIEGSVINESNKDLSKYRKGNFDDLLKYVMDIKKGDVI